MLPQNPLLQLAPLRIDSAVRRLQSLIWTAVRPLEVFGAEPTAMPLTFEEAIRKPLGPISEGAAWGKLFDQRWCRITLPDATNGSDWLNWRDQGEATLYIGGKPFFGFDIAHRYCKLPAGIREFWLECHCVQSAIWHAEAKGISPIGSLFDGAFLVSRNDDAWHAFHDLQCLLEVALLLRRQENVYLTSPVSPGCTQPSVETHSPVFRRMLRLMDQAVDILDEEGPAAMRVHLAEAYRELKKSGAFMKCVATGHAHIDLVWLWPERIGEIKAVHTFSTVNRLMREYPEFRFAYSQPASYEAVQRRSPGLYEEVKDQIHNGRWQATGGMYVESDTLIACGEALLRSFLIGQDCFTEIRGTPSRLTWLPDVFGYSACLPQMMRLAGINYFFTTKLTWSMINRFPYSSFVWRGNDGSEVLAHVTQDSGYNGQMDVNELKSSSWGHQQGDQHPEYLLPTGFGDGGGGPTAEMCERARRLSGLPGLPSIEWDHPEQFFDRLEPLRSTLPSYHGECYLEGHRGTFTTHGNLKAAFRDLERALQVREAACCVTGNRPDLLASWKRLVFAQFHDYIPGSSVWDVYLEGIPELLRLAAEQRTASQKELGGEECEYCVFNPHAVTVRRWLESPTTRTFIRVEIPPLSGVFLQDHPIADRVFQDASRIWNESASFTLNEQGWIEELMFEGSSIPLSDPAGQLWYYHDQPARFEAWDVDRHTLALGKVCDAPAVIEPFREGQMRAGFHVSRPVGEASSAKLTFYLEAGSPLLHIRVSLDWREPHGLLKLLVPTKFAGSSARFGAPYTSVLRPQVVHGPISEAMWEVPFSRWLAVFDDAERNGLFVVTENKYGATVRDGVIGLSLVRSPLVAGCDGLRTAWPKHLSRLKIPGDHSDIGLQTFSLALGHYHSSLSRERHPAGLADTLFTEPLLYQGRTWPSPIREIRGSTTVIPAWAVPSHDGAWLLRLHEVGGQRGDLEVIPENGWSCCTSNATGTALEESAVRFSISPYQILTIRFVAIA